MSDIAILAENVSKRYSIAPGQQRHDTLYHQLAETLRVPFRRGGRQKNREFWALQDISFTARQGEALGVIGHNGAGKSTLLKILSRITEPTSGRARIYGRVGSLLEVGTGFHPELTGRENIFLNGAIIGMKREEIRRLFDAIVDFAEIEEFIDTPVKRYSSGMYVRLAFAVSAHLRPEILIIDEVLSVGDLQFQRKCTAYAEELQKSGATILLVSHNMFVVKALCNRVLYLSHGGMKGDGTPEEVIPIFEREGAAAGSQYSPEAGVAISITDVELFDESGNRRAIFDFGERMRIRLSYETPQEIENPNFVVSLVRSDEIACCNYSTALDDFPIPVLCGEGTIEVTTPPLKLVSESYEIHVLVWDKDFKRPYCFRKGVSFHVRHHLFSTHFGIFHEDAQWSIPEEIVQISQSPSQEVCCHD